MKMCKKRCHYCRYYVTGESGEAIKNYLIFHRTLPFGVTYRYVCEDCCLLDRRFLLATTTPYKVSDFKTTGNFINSNLTMKSKSKFCESCNACVINSIGIVIENALHLVREKSHIYICNPCINFRQANSFRRIWFSKIRPNLAGKQMKFLTTLIFQVLTCNNTFSSLHKILNTQLTDLLRLILAMLLSRSIISTKPLL